MFLTRKLRKEQQTEDAPVHSFVSTSPSSRLTLTLQCIWLIACGQKLDVGWTDNWVTSMGSDLFWEAVQLLKRRMGNVRQEPLTVKQTDLGSNQRMDFVVSAMCGWRLTMEDAHIANPNLAKGYGLFAVFDGHGGAEVSAFASKFFGSELLKNKNFQSKRYQDALTETFQTIDKLLLSKQGQKEINKIRKEISEKENSPISQESTNAGCTAVVCLITEHDIYCANAGDSRSFIYRNKVVEDMSKDHKPDLPKEKSRIKKAGGVITDGRINGCLNLSRGFGDFQFKANKRMKADQQMVISKPDITKAPLQGTQYVVLGCDGIFQEKTNKQIMSMIKSRSKGGLKLAAEGILDQLLAETKQMECGGDNMSLVIVRMK